MEDEAVTRLFRVRRTVFQMLRDRGYNVEESDINLKREDFVERFGNPVNKDSLFVEANKGPNPADKIYVFFVEGQKVGKPVLTTIVGKMRGDNVGRGILVVPAQPSPMAKAMITELSKAYTLEVFEECELVSNITEHKLVNKYYVLDDKAKKQLLDKYTVKETQLPRILGTDPVARYYGLRRGQVVKIRRTDLTSTDYYTYRCCV